jgi:DNA-binding Lrp family transcriptional regulator
MITENLDYNFYLDTSTFKEESLVFVLETLLIQKDKYFNDKNKKILRELDCWQGRADLVVAEIRGREILSKEKAMLLSNLTNAQIVSLLHKNAPRTLNFLINRTGLTESTVKRSLRSLLNEGIVAESSNRSYILHPDFEVPKVIFNAYEVKLHNWRRALYQAIQYFGFANNSWVVMPKKHISPALHNIELFKANGVGLISIDENGEVFTHLKAKKYQPSKKAFYLVGIGKLFM